ncbi:Crp/Fnr family transcriptional regulator [Roseivirga sp.]|uniref:Crp/Fnr family transcriptional regulator n=1 Tax=Roseivirga sp. TaxID=1964215 RepID=UPI003B52C0D9
METQQQQIREDCYGIPCSGQNKLLTKRFGKLYREGQKMKYAYILLNGAVTLIGRNDEGKRVVLHEAKAGEILGVQALQNEGRSTHSAFIRKSSRFMAIQLTGLATQMENIPGFRNALTNQLINHIDVLENLISCS